MLQQESPFQQLLLTYLLYIDGACSGIGELDSIDHGWQPKKKKKS